MQLNIFLIYVALIFMIIFVAIIILQNALLLKAVHDANDNHRHYKDDDDQNGYNFNYYHYIDAPGTQ